MENENKKKEDFISSLCSLGIEYNEEEFKNIEKSINNINFCDNSYKQAASVFAYIQTKIIQYRQKNTTKEHEYAEYCKNKIKYYKSIIDEFEDELKKNGYKKGIVCSVLDKNVYGLAGVSIRSCVDKYEFKYNFDYKIHNDVNVGDVVYVKIVDSDLKIIEFV